MRRLILMRHAKSDWARGVQDHARPLNERGRRAAPLMGRYIMDEGLTPDLALVSSAARTQETWRLSGIDAAMETQGALYHAGAGGLLAAARSAPDDARTLLILTHQPGVQEAANRLLPASTIDEYPTAKIAVIEFDAACWADIGFGSGRLEREMAPRLLEA